MKVKRTEKIKVDLFQVGDIISFKLNGGERVQMLAVKDELDGMIFCSVDCLAEESCMNKSSSSAGGWNESNLRAKLNGKILSRFPEKIKEMLIPFANGDLIRIPTVSEIFGENEYGKSVADAEQWEPMKQRRNRTALRGLNGAWRWYWLKDRVPNPEALFVRVNGGGGFAHCALASLAAGVRPVVKIKNPISVHACQVQDDEDEQGGEKYGRTD